SSQAFSTAQSRTRKLRGIPSNAERAGGSWAAVDRYSGQNVRDRFMAANVSWWLNTLGEGTKIAIWAHNGHIARGLNEGLTWIVMGKHLSDVFGDNYLPIGFSFAEGNFNSFPRGAVEVTAEPLIPGCYEAALQTTQLARFFIDLRELESGSAAHDWMIVERPFQAIGGGPYSAPHYLGWDYPIVLPKSFDIIIHIETTTATQVR
ncbi:erythromycin esterase family protein, partial [Candidatus Bipolaricaulota bacterium]